MGTSSSGSSNSLVAEARQQKPLSPPRRRRRVSALVIVAVASFFPDRLSWTAAVSLTLLSNWIVFWTCVVLRGDNHNGSNNPSSSSMEEMLLLPPLGTTATAVTTTTSLAQQKLPLNTITPPPRCGSTRLAYDQSLGFFHDICDADWIEFFQTPVREARNYRYDDDNNNNTTNVNQGSKFPAQWNFFNWDRTFNCPHLQKVGGLGGGAKWTCDVDRLQRVVQERRQQQPTDDPASTHWYVSLFCLASSQKD
jgi:hypothetical protein